MAAVGSVYLNFVLWGIAILPAWLLVKEVGDLHGDKKLEREARVLREPSDTVLGN
jgi:hypothetical protein